MKPSEISSSNIKDPGRLALKINEAADAIGVTPVTIRRLIKRGLIKPSRALRHVLIPVAELNRFLGQ